MPKMLGKLPAKVDARTLKLVNYIPAVLPEIPQMVRWDKVKEMNAWGMDGNDQFGNCVIVTAAHIIDCARACESELMDRVSDVEAIALSTEMGALNGYYVLDRLKWWRRRGMFGSSIAAFVALTGDHDLIRSAINIFGHCDIGLSMPVAWQNGDVWDVGPGRAYEYGSWGGHSVPLLGYETRGGTIFYYACTWGHIVLITKQAIDAYCDELYASILPEWLALDNVTPSGFDMAALLKDLEAIG